MTANPTIQTFFYFVASGVCVTVIAKLIYDGIRGRKTEPPLQATPVRDCRDCSMHDRLERRVDELDDIVQCVQRNMIKREEWNRVIESLYGEIKHLRTDIGAVATGIEVLKALYEKAEGEKKLHV